MLIHCCTKRIVPHEYAVYHCPRCILVIEVYYNTKDNCWTSRLIK